MFSIQGSYKSIYNKHFLPYSLLPQYPALLKRSILNPPCTVYYYKLAMIASLPILGGDKGKLPRSKPVYRDVSGY